MKLFSDNPEEFPYAEERRLFYVAMTRAKKKVIFVPPSSAAEQSCFYEEISSCYENDINAEEWTCPKCGGHLKKKNGPYGPFIGCSNYHRENQKCTFTRNLSQGKISLNKSECHSKKKSQQNVTVNLDLSNEGKATVKFPCGQKRYFK